MGKEDGTGRSGPIPEAQWNRMIETWEDEATGTSVAARNLALVLWPFLIGFMWWCLIYYTIGKC